MGFDALIRRWARARILVVGDVMLDQFIWGRAERVSPEAPVLVLNVADESFHPGGAGNVANNVRALGGQVTICGVIGDDATGKRLKTQLRQHDVDTAGLIRARSVVTSCKTRVIAHSQQVVRFDREQREHQAPTVRRLSQWLAREARNYDAVLVSDYGKGVINPATLAALRDGVQGPPVIVDPKKPNYEHYRGVTLATPNVHEAADAAGIDIRNAADLKRAGAKLLQLWQAAAVLITRGEQGMTLIRADGGSRNFPTVSRQVFDVTGAGDTVAAVCALALAAGAELEQAADLANHAAGIVVGKLGTATVTPAELRHSLARTQP